MARYRNAVVEQAEKWIGLKATNKSNDIILRTYNENKPLPRGYKVKQGDNWCATFASAVFIALGYNDIFPIECSCGQMIDKAKTMGIWIENDTYVPNLGDCILYDWDDNGKGDDTGWPDHVGIVTYVNQSAGYIVVTEGNYSKSVKKRTININGKYIRGYITPKFDELNYILPDITNQPEKSISTVAHEVIAGQWGSGDERKRKLAAAGYDYKTIQNEVNRILNTPSQTTIKAAKSVKSVVSSVRPNKFDVSLNGNYQATANLHIRDGAGTNKKTLKLMSKGNIVTCNGYYTISNGLKWYYITTTIGGVKYTGFSCSKYLVRR